MPCLGFHRGVLRILQADPSLAPVSCTQASPGLKRSRSGVTFLGWPTSRPAVGTRLCSSAGPACVSNSSGPSAISMLQHSGMAVADRDHLAEEASLFAVPPGLNFSYGTAGFRGDAGNLISTVFRCGVLAALRSLCTRQVTGLMITASHNPVQENGVKLADPQGGMLVMGWEMYADALANAADHEAFLLVVDRIMTDEKIITEDRAVGEVLVARDTRPSGQGLAAIAIQGVQAVGGCSAKDLGVLATPQLHWMVRCRNGGQDASEIGYFRQLSGAFSAL